MSTLLHTPPFDEGMLSDRGRLRVQNEDSYGSYRTQGNEIVPLPSQTLLERKGYLYIVADGLGGHESGEVASELAVRHIRTAYYDDPEDNPEASLRRAIDVANQIIYLKARSQLRPGGKTMGTTVVCAVLHGGALTIAHVGDSRAYHIRNGQILYRTSDHVWSTLRADHQAGQEGPRGKLRRAVGVEAAVTSDISTRDWLPDDSVLLCSDGLHSLVSEDVIVKMLTSYPALQAAKELVDRANQAGGRDNITALVVMHHRTTRTRTERQGSRTGDTAQQVFQGKLAQSDVPSNPTPKQEPPAVPANQSEVRSPNQDAPAPSVPRSNDPYQPATTLETTPSVADPHKPLARSLWFVIGGGIVLVVVFLLIMVLIQGLTRAGYAIGEQTPSATATLLTATTRSTSLPTSTPHMNITATPGATNVPINAIPSPISSSTPTVPPSPTPRRPSPTAQQEAASPAPATSTPELSPVPPTLPPTAEPLLATPTAPPPPPTEEPGIVMPNLLGYGENQAKEILISQGISGGQIIVDYQDRMSIVQNHPQLQKYSDYAVISTQPLADRRIMPGQSVVLGVILTISAPPPEPTVSPAVSQDEPSPEPAPPPEM